MLSLPHRASYLPLKAFSVYVYFMFLFIELVSQVLDFVLQPFNDFILWVKVVIYHRPEKKNKEILILLTNIDMSSASKLVKRPEVT